MKYLLLLLCLVGGCGCDALTACELDCVDGCLLEMNAGIASCKLQCRSLCQEVGR